MLTLANKNSRNRVPELHFSHLIRAGKGTIVHFLVPKRLNFFNVQVGALFSNFECALCN